MNDNKRWYLSRTVWAGLVALTLPLAGALGLGTDTLDHGILTETLLQLATAVAGLVAVLGRIGATSRIL